MKQHYTIYKISLDSILHSNTKLNERFVFNQLCEDSRRGIQREVQNSNFLLDQNESRLLVYQRIITPVIMRDIGCYIKNLTVTQK